MPLATIMITKNTGSAVRLCKPDPYRGELLRCGLENHALRVGDGEEAFRRQGEVPGEPRVPAQLRDRPLVPAEDDRVEFPRRAGRLPPAEDREGGARGRVERLACLLLPAAG